jgi:hypothetical protein
VLAWNRRKPGKGEASEESRPGNVPNPAKPKPDNRLIFGTGRLAAGADLLF